MPTVAGGLEGVVFTETGVCFIDGTVGHLLYRGYDIQDVAEHLSFEEVAYLLWLGKLPNRQELETLHGQFAAERDIPSIAYDVIDALPPNTVPMDGLRTVVSFLSGTDPELDDNSADANYRKAVRLTAKAPTIMAAVHRRHFGLDPVIPQPTGSLAYNFLYMLSGQEPDEFVAQTLDVALTLHAEHGMNASTFAGRVTVATLADMYAGVTSAIGALKGPLHGGANAVVLKMLQEIGDPDHARDYVNNVISGDYVVPGMAPRRVPGFGHRVYKAFDPRAIVLRGMSKKLGERAGDSRWVDISNAVVEACAAAGLNEKGIYPNVDFFSASSYYTMGIPESLFTPVFAIARMTGWTAHIIEQQSDNRLIRPRADYIGEKGLKVVPIDQR
ncbi:MAG: citrate synthase [Candidatus Poribacteria bacterium]|nr:citrate synthase [Candidatus Poribacteria bacterium]